MRNRTGILQSQRPSISSDNHLRLSCPKSWAGMSQEQLRHTFDLIASGYYNSVELRTILLLRFNGITVLKNTRWGFSCVVKLDNGKKKYFYLQDWQVQYMIGQLEYIDSYEDMGTRLERLCGCTAADVQLHGLTFHDYLMAEKYYQVFLSQRDPKWLNKLAVFLYSDESGNHLESMDLTEGELMATFAWFSYVKSLFAKMFHHFFKRVGDGQNVPEVNFRESMDAQIRALTEGDVTKEQQIYDTDCWRALTELNFKAREAEEFRQRMKK